MISCPEAAASIRRVKPEPGSLWMKQKNNETSDWNEPGVSRVNGSCSLDVSIGIVIQKELDHLLVAGAGAVKQSSPASTILHLQLSTLLSE